MEDGEGSTATVFKTNDLYNFIYEKYADFKFKVGEYVTLSYDWELTGTPSSNTTYPTKIRTEISDTPYRYGTVINSVGTNGPTSTIKNITSSQKSGHICIVYKIDSDSSVSNAKKVRFRIDNLLSNYYVTISNLKLEKGNKATDWTPAPEDIESSVDNIQIGSRNLLIGTRTQDTTKGNQQNQVTLTEDTYMGCAVFKANAAWSDIGFSFDRLMTNNTVKPGDILTYSIYIKSDDDTVRNLGFYMGTRVNGQTKYYYAGTKPSSIYQNTIKNGYGWVKFHYTFEVLESMFTDVKELPISTRIEFTTSTTSGKFIYFAAPKLEFGNKATDWTPAPEDVDSMIAKTVKQVDVEYYLSTSSSSATGGSWSTTAPAWVDGKYMWSRQKVTYVDDTTATRNETCIAGAKGETGSTGGTGATGTGVESITEEYYLSTSKSSQTGGSWITTPPTWSTGKYIWTRSKIVYKNPASTVYTTPLCSSEWEAVNNVNVGGTNLILKSSFLYDTEPTDKNWSTWTVNNITYRRFTVDGYEYKAAADNGAINSSVGLRVSLAQLGLKKGDTISISYDIKGKMGTINNGLAVMHATAASSNFYAKIYAKVNGAAHPTSIPDWTRVKGTWTIDSDFPSNNDYIYIFFGGGTGSEVDLFVRNVKVEKGNKPTEWSPAPKDMNDMVDDLTIGARNYIEGSSNEWKSVTLSDTTNITIRPAVATDLTTKGLKPGDTLRISCYIKFSDDITYTGTGTKQCKIQGTRNSGGTWTNVSFTGGDMKSQIEDIIASESKEGYVYTYIVLPSNFGDGTYTDVYDLNFRFDYFTGIVYVKDFMVCKGDKYLDWNPAPEDVASDIGNVQTVALGAKSAVEAVNEVAKQASLDISTIKGYIQSLVVDENGQSMMTQTGNGWQFNMGTVNNNLDSLSKAVDDMSNDNEDTKALLDDVKSLAESIADKTAYINVDYTTDASGNPIPRMILGAETSAFKIRITNESIDFMESDTVMAYATSNTFYNLTTVVQKELEIGSGPSFVWTVRSNGNLGLTYKS